MIALKKGFMASPRQARLLSQASWPLKSFRIFNIRLVKLDRHARPEEPHVQHLDHDREGHGKVNVPLGYVHVKAVAHQRHADQDQEINSLPSLDIKYQY